MRHSFLDKYSGIDSPIHKFDPRLKFIIIILGIIAIASEPNGYLLPYAFYGALAIFLILLSKVPLAFIVKRLLIVLPFILMAALFYPVSIYISDRETFYAHLDIALLIALSIFLKSTLSVTLLVLLISTEKFHNLLSALRMLKMPRIIGTISALMYRYVFIFADEALKTNLAKKSRTPGKLRMSRITVLSNQMAMIFIRSWDRSGIIYNSMVSRGFNGEFVSLHKFRIKAAELVFFILTILFLISIRVFIK